MGAIYNSNGKHQEWTWSPFSWRAGEAEAVPFSQQMDSLKLLSIGLGTDGLQREQICSADPHTRRTWTPQAPRAQARSRVKQTELAGRKRVWRGQSWAWPWAGREKPAWVQALTHHCSMWDWVIPKHSSLGLTEISWRPALAHIKAHYQEIRVYSVYLVSYENTR